MSISIVRDISGREMKITWAKKSATLRAEFEGELTVQSMEGFFEGLVAELQDKNRSDIVCEFDFSKVPLVSEYVKEVIFEARDACFFLGVKQVVFKLPSRHEATRLTQKRMAHVRSGQESYLAAA